MSKAAKAFGAAPAKPRHDVAEIFARAWAYHQNGLTAEAQSLYRAVLRKQPHHFEALHLLGLSEYQHGRFEDAARAIKRALTVDPRSAVAHCNLAAVSLAADRPQDALASCDRAIALQPDYADAHYNRGTALTRLQRLEEAIASFDSVIAFNPKHAAAFSDRGTALHRLGRVAEAIASYGEALALKPDSIGTLNNRGCALVELRQAQDALADFERAIALAPDYADGWMNRGEALVALERLDDALASYDRALQLNPQLTEAWLGCGNIFMLRRKVAEALAACQRALAIEPNSVRGLTQLAQCLALLGDAASAIAAFDRALANKPDDEIALSNKIFTLDFDESCDYAAHQRARSEWWHRIGAKIFAACAQPHDNDRDPQRRIVLGYVSSDFRRRSPAYAIRPVLQNHDKSRFDIVCYSGCPHEDEVTQTFREVADRWHSIAQWSDDALADCVRADKIDILIDLSGHSAGNRLRVFARKPAPLQVHAWGFGTGTGLPTIDCMFSDSVVLPAEVRHLFAEQIVDLPSATIMEAPPAALRASEPPALSNGHLTFGVFNRVSKISDAAVSVWGRILRSAPAARLVIKDQLLDDPSIQGALLERFGAQGISRERIDLFGSTSREDHLAAYRRVDVCLDPFPQSGGISTWEALHMGVPVVAKLAASVSGRLAGAIQSAIGMPEWVAASEDEYVEIALRAAPERLGAIRRDLPARIEAHCGPLVYTRAVEQAYRTMWETYCAGA